MSSEIDFLSKAAKERMAAAAMAGQASDLPRPPPERLAIPSRNPLPLSASQESQVRDIYYARVRKQCADEIKGQTTEPLLPPTLGYNSC